MRNTCWVSIVLIASLLTGCTTLASQQQSDIAMAPGVRMVLPPLKDFGKSVEATQLVTVHYGEQTFVFQSRIHLTPSRCLMEVFDPMGRTAMTIDWRPAGMTYVAATWLPAQVRPKNILADFVLLNWPAASVQRAINHSRAELISRPKMRSVLSADHEMI